PFFVVATQNPAEFHGTYPLPESQLDRFILAAEMGPPTDEEAMEVLARREHGDPIGDLRPVLSLQEVTDLQESALRVVAAPAIRAYIVALLNAIRARPEVQLPASMRAGLYLQRAAQAWALFAGRDFVLPDDTFELDRLRIKITIGSARGTRGPARAYGKVGAMSMSVAAGVVRKSAGHIEQLQLQPSRRGAVEMSDWWLQSGDPLGLFKRI